MRIYYIEMNLQAKRSEWPWMDLEVAGSEQISESLQRAAQSPMAPQTGKAWNTDDFTAVNIAPGLEGRLFSMLDAYNIYFTVDPDGVAYSHDTAREITWGDLWRAVDDGLYHPSVAVRVGMLDGGLGRGGGGSIMLEAAHFLSPYIAEIVSGVAAGLGTHGLLALSHRVTRKRASRKVILQAREFLESAPAAGLRQTTLWHEQGLLGKNELVQFIYRRGHWSLDVLATRLRISQSEAEILLARACRWRKLDGIEGEYIPGELTDEFECLQCWQLVEELLSESRPPSSEVDDARTERGES